MITATNLVSGASTSLDIDVSGYNYSTLAPTKELSKSQIKLNKSVYKRGDELSADISSAIKEGIAPVSYTHLDVYKRQSLSSASKISLLTALPTPFAYSQMWINAIISFGLT